jgi:DNA-binding LytR/AlgR family response regulator
MKVIIIEDEILAQQKLEAMLNKLNPRIEVIAKIGSVKEALSWLAANAIPDLAFVDIQLSDDHSFEIFKQYQISFPVIFTTAYDKYLLESFEFNSIDYLLKPITEANLRRSFDKFETLEKHFVQGNLLKLIQRNSQPEKKRVIAKKGTEFIALQLDNISYFYTEHKIVFARDVNGQNFIIDKTLGELEEILDKQDFFRLNRKFIAHLVGIERFKPDSGKIKIHLTPPMREDVFVSKESAPAFRAWISGG